MNCGQLRNLCRSRLEGKCGAGRGTVVGMEPRTPAANTRDNGLLVIAVMVALMWVLEIVDTIANHRLDQYGIEPRDADGLIGIGAAPFLHADFGHLASNTVPFVVMGFVIALSGAARVLAVTAIVALVSGVGTWLVGPDHTNHIGASGVVFGYGAYLIARGFFNRSMLELAVGVLVAVVFGGALLSGLAPTPGVSWQGHLFGAIGGVVAARLLAPERPDVRRPAAA
jgi:membrane associated rhomboid family serine protease